MLGIQLNVLIDEVCFVPKAKQVINELDQVARVMGFQRFQEEKSKDFKSFYHEWVAESRKDSDKQSTLLPLELRIPTESVVFENTDTDNFLNKVVVTNDMKLKVFSYIKSASELFRKKVYEYDLLDRRSYPFLEDLLNKVNKEVLGLNSFITPYGDGRNNHLLPYHLNIGQNNYEKVTEVFQNGNEFILNNKFPIPDSLQLISVNIPIEESNNISFVNYKSLVDEEGKIQIDCWKSSVKSFVNYFKYESLFKFDKLKKISIFKCSPGCTLINYSSLSILNRLNEFENVREINRKIFYQSSASSVSNGYSYSGCVVSKNVIDAYKESELKKINQNRWG